jgi:DNA-directed RNA polymerase subunit L
MNRSELRRAARIKVVHEISDRMQMRLRASEEITSAFAMKVAKMEDALEAEYAARENALDQEYREKQRELERKIEDMRRKLGQSTSAAVGTRSIQLDEA